MNIEKRVSELATYLDKQPYMTELDGIQLEIAKNVFPSDFGLTSSFVGAFILEQPPKKRALDMACGSGYFAFLFKNIGCTEVLGVDFNTDAIMCATENEKRNPQLQPIQFIHSDLFESVPKQTFDLIMFNFNYYPSDGNFGLNADGGQEILRRFFTQVPDYIHDETVIYIPYSEFVGQEHDPKTICPEYGFTIETAATLNNENGEHYIYKITQA